jgi:uncharacterized protein YqhQ
MPVKQTHIGGQAVIEGVMMRGKLNWAVAVREPGGTIYVEEHDLPIGAHNRAYLRWPIVRGCWAMYETLSLAMKALMISAEHADIGGESTRDEAAGTDESPAAARVDAAAPAEAAIPPGTAVTESAPAGEEADAEPAAAPALSAGEMALSLGMGVVLAVGIFIILPAVATNLLGEYVRKHSFAWNIIDGVLRLAVFFLYIWAVGRMRDIKRLFQYHGAEHKTIHAYEHGMPLEPKYIQKWDTLHVRCGTSFLLMVMVIAILVFSLVPVTTLWARIAVRILLLPVVAGLAYEVTVKWAGSRPDNPLVKVLLWPGMQMQRLTTGVPDDSMVEVAVAAMSRVVAREEAEAAAAEVQAAPPLPAID